MSRMDLRNDHTLVIGKKGMGKSNWLQYQLDPVDRALTYDVCREHDALTRYLPEYRSGDRGRAELGEVTRSLVIGPDAEARPEVFAVEELSRYCGPHRPAPEPIMDVVDLHRHYSTGETGLGFVGVTRRPSQVHTDVVELADRLVAFRLTGRSDKRRLDDVIDGLGEAVGDLGKYEYVVADVDGFEVHEPVPEMDTTGEL